MLRVAFLTVLLLTACIRQPAPDGLPPPPTTASTAPRPAPVVTTTPEPATPVLAVRDERLVGSITYDVWLPADPALVDALPVVVLLHGAGPAGKETLEPLAVALARRNLAVFNTEYLPPAHGGLYPGPFVAAHCMVAVATHTAAGLGGDPDRVIVVGYSFGGLAATIAAHTADRFASPDCPAPDARPAGWAALAGSFDLDQLESVAGDAMGAFFGGDRQARPELWDSVDPYLQERSPGAALVVYATADQEVPPSIAVEYADFLRTNDEPVTLRAVRDASHTTIIDPELFPEVADLIVEFAQRPSE